MKNFLCMGSLCLITSPVVAAKPIVADSLRQQTLEAAQVVATRANHQTPIAFSNVSKEQIQRANVGPDVPYLLSFLPSVTATSDAGAGIGYTSLRIRGTDPSRINVTANGIPLNDAESNALYWVNMADFAGTLGSIQVQRGVGNSTNGSGAFGASVNLQTEGISTVPYLRLNVSGGSYNTHKESLLFGTGLLRNHWAFSGRLSNIASKGYIKASSSNLNSYFLQGGYYSDRTIVKLVTFNGVERTGLAWQYATKSDIDRYGRTYNPLGLYENYSAHDTTNVYYKDNVDNYHQQHYQLFWNQTLTDELKWNLAFHYTKGKGYYQQYKPTQKLVKYGLSSTLGGKSDLIRRKYSEADFYGTVFSLNYKKNGLLSILGGGWNQYDGDHYGKVLWVRNFDGSINPNQPYYGNKARKRDFNIYTRTQYEFVKGLSAYLDLQYRYIDYKMYGPSDIYEKKSKSFLDYNEHHFFNFFNPKAGLTWQFHPNHKVYGSWAMAHKEPTRKDYENAVEGYENVPQSERLNDFELGYRYSDPHFLLGLNFYYMLYKDQFVLTGKVNEIGYPIKKNVGDSYRRGLEFEAAWKPCKYFTWATNFTWSHNRIKNNKIFLSEDALKSNSPISLGNTPISMSPDFLWNNVLRFHMDNFNASILTHYVGPQYLTNTGFKRYETDAAHEGDLFLSDYATTDIDLNYVCKKVPLCKDLTVGCTLYNVFNKKYYANGFASTDIIRDEAGQLHAQAKGNSWSVFSAQAPINFLFYLSIGF